MFKPINPNELDGNVFTRIEKQWMLITAGTAEQCNTMTASWGSLGVLWNKPVATCYIRPQRHTLSFVQEQPCFTLSFLPEQYRKELTLCGTKSGRELDKIAACGFSVLPAACGAPYIAEAELVLVCRKLYTDTIKPECLIDQSIEQLYKGDYHHFFIGEITEVLKKM